MRHDVLILPSPRANRYHVDYWITHIHEVLCGTRCLLYSCCDSELARDQAWRLRVYVTLVQLHRIRQSSINFINNPSDFKVLVCRIVCKLSDCLCLRGSSCSEAQIPALQLVARHDRDMRNLFILALLEGPFDV